MDSIGRSVLSDNFSRIICSPLDPLTLAAELFAHKLINDTIIEQAASEYLPKKQRLRAIVDAVMKNGNPNCFWLFVEAVRKDPSCEWLARELNVAYMTRSGGCKEMYPRRHPPAPSMNNSISPSIRSLALRSDKPTLKYLNTLPTVDWYSVGLQLDLDDSDLEIISKDHQGDSNKAQMAMYRLWLKCGDNVSYQKLVDALMTAKEIAVAQQVCKQFTLLPSPTETKGPLKQHYFQVPTPLIPQAPFGMFYSNCYESHFTRPPADCYWGLQQGYYYWPGPQLRRIELPQPNQSVQPTSTFGIPCDINVLHALGGRSRTPPPQSHRDKYPLTLSRCPSPSPRLRAFSHSSHVATPAYVDDESDDELTDTLEDEVDGPPLSPESKTNAFNPDGKSKHISFEPYTASYTKKWKSIELSFGKIPILKQKAKPVNPYPNAKKLKKQGIAVIINNEIFVRHGHREGTTIDEGNLIHTFRYLRYQVELYRDCNSKQMLEIMETVQRMDHSNFNSFVCCILSHGKEGHVFGSDSEVVSLNSIASKFSAENCISLALKPKLFFVQACRGGKKVEGVPVEMDSDNIAHDGPYDESSAIQVDGKIVVIPRDANFLFSYASPYGQVCFRDCDHGSWYVTELCRALCQHSKYLHLHDMLLHVNEKVGSQEHDYRQAPEVRHGLHHNVYF